MLCTMYGVFRFYVVWIEFESVVEENGKVNAICNKQKKENRIILTFSFFIFYFLSSIVYTTPLFSINFMKVSKVKGCICSV